MIPLRGLGQITSRLMRRHRDDDASSLAQAGSSADGDYTGLIRLQGASFLLGHLV